MAEKARFPINKSNTVSGINANDTVKMLVSALLPKRKPTSFFRAGSGPVITC